MTDIRCLACSAITDAWLCRVCTDRLEQHLAELPSLFAELTVTETRQGRTYRAGGRSERDAEPAYDPEADVEPRLRSKDGRIALRGFALPYDEAADTLRDECWSTVTTWARHLSESRGVEIQLPQRRVGKKLMVIRANRCAGWLTEWIEPTSAELQSALCTWLVASVESVRFDEAAAEMVDEIADVHRRLTRHIDSSPSRTFWGRCDADTYEPVEADGVITITKGECGRDLYAKDAATTIVCDGHRGDGHGCGAARSVDDVRDGLLDLMSEHLAPLDAIKAVLPLLGVDLPKPGLWRSWVHRRQLQAKGSARGVPLYSGRDVLALVLDEGSRRGPKRGAA